MQKSTMSALHGSTEYDIPQKMLTAHLEKPFNAKFNSIGCLNITSVQQFFRTNAEIFDQIRKLEDRAVARVILHWRKHVGTDRSALYDRIPAISRVLGRRVSNHCIRTWHARAFTLLIYNLFVVPARLERLQDAPLERLLQWSLALREKFQLLLDSKQVDAQDMLMAFGRAALAKHRMNKRCVAVHKPNVGEQREFELVLPAVCLENLNGAALKDYSMLCCEELLYFASQMPDAHDREETLSAERIQQMWLLYLFSVHQRRGDDMESNPYQSHLSRQSFIVEQFPDLHGAVMRLRNNTSRLIARWRQESLFECAVELERIWLNRIDCLAQGLECAFFMHRIIRQDLMLNVVAFAERKIAGKMKRCCLSEQQRKEELSSSNLTMQREKK